MTAKGILNKRKFNPDEPIALSESEVEDLMNEFARHIAEKAVMEEKSKYGHTHIFDQFGKRNTCDNILSRIKQLTETK